MFDRLDDLLIRYEELMEEHCFQMVDGLAYVPLYSGQSCILFQDESFPQADEGAVGSGSDCGGI